MYFSEQALELARKVVESAVARGLSITTAESCTGGLIAACLTEVPGTSETFDRGFITYSNAAKADLLGVPEALFAEVGAVSERVARAMAEGAAARGGTDLAVAVTGIAGPTGGTPAKPVGLVHIAAARRDGATIHRRAVFEGGREDVRTRAVEAALALLLDLIEDQRVIV